MCFAGFAKDTFPFRNHIQIYFKEIDHLSDNNGFLNTPANPGSFSLEP